MKVSTIVTCSIASVFFTSTAQAFVLCAKPRSDGTYNTSIKVREACRTGETQLDAAQLGVQGAQGNAGAAGPPGVSGYVRVLDGGGTDLGVLLSGFSETPGTMLAEILEPGMGRSFMVRQSVSSGSSRIAFTNNCTSNIDFELPGCAGQAHSHYAGLVLCAMPIPGDPDALAPRFFSSDSVLVPPSTIIRSYLNATGCIDLASPHPIGSDEYSKATEVILPFSLPLAPPLSVVLAP